jgi:aryl-alcohol dehydrogenase-like predicted oxidoreductase
MSEQRIELPPDQVAEAERHINTEQLTATQLQALVRNMDHSKKKWRHLRREEYIGKLKNENENLFFNYPSLWQMHAEDRLDSTFFEMLALKRKIEKGEITEEQATASVGQRLFQRYSPEVVNSNANAGPPPMSYAEYYKKFGGSD